MPAPTVKDGSQPQPGTPDLEGRSWRRLLAVAPVTHAGGAGTPGDPDQLPAALIEVLARRYSMNAADHEGAKRFYADTYAAGSNG